MKKLHAETIISNNNRIEQEKKKKTTPKLREGKRESRKGKRQQFTRSVPSTCSNYNMPPFANVQKYFYHKACYKNVAFIC